MTDFERRAFMFASGQVLAKLALNTVDAPTRIRPDNLVK